MLGVGDGSSVVQIHLVSLSGKGLSKADSFIRDLAAWEQEGVHLGEDRTEAVRILKVAYECYSKDPDFYSTLNLSDSVFCTISSFSSLSLANHFPHITEINFSNCAALIELPVKLPVSLKIINFSNCKKLQLSSECLQSLSQLSLIGVTQSGMKQSENESVIGESGKLLVPLMMTIQEQWKNSPQDLLKYANLNNLVEQKQLVRLDQGGAFFVITHPAYAEKSAFGLHSMGWKLHISVCPVDLEKAFDLVAPIISKYCFYFKVTNPINIANERFIQGAQITIYLERGEKPLITPQEAEMMVKEINQSLLENNIQQGKIPDSDAETFSPYCSLRADKWKIMLVRPAVNYLPARIAGKNFNPGNNPNPFCNLLRGESKPFDPYDHFLSLGEDRVNTSRSKEIPFHLTLSSCVREYTLFDTMDDAAQEKFIFEFCLGYGNNLDARFLKEPYRESNEILLDVRLAFSLVLFYEADLSLAKRSYYNYLATAQLATRYPCLNSFKKFMALLEVYSTQQNEINLGGQNKKVHSLDELFKRASRRIMDKLPAEQLIVLLQTGHFYNSQAALNKLKGCCSPQEFEHLLQQNENIPAAQIALVGADRFLNDENLASYFSSVSEASHCVRIIFADYLSFLMKHKTPKELHALYLTGDSIAAFALTLIYAHDVVQAAPNIQRFANVPVNHGLAKAYLNTLQRKKLFANDFVEINKRLT